MRTTSGSVFQSVLWLLFAASTSGCDADASRAPDVAPPPPMPRDSKAIPRLRRLTRDEVGATLRDLLAEPQALANDLPGDPIGTYFDNLAESQFLQSMHTRAMIEIAQTAITRAWARRTATPAPLNTRIVGPPSGPGEPMNPPRITAGTGPEIIVAGGVMGTIRLRANVRSTDEARGPFEIRVVQDGLLVGRSVVRIEGSAPGATQIDILPLLRNEGDAILTLQANILQGGPANLELSELRIEGPIVRDDQRVGICDPVLRGESTCVDDELGAFATRAWRRPVTGDELARLQGLYRARRGQGDTYEAALQVALAAILASPQFLFLLEAPPNAAPGSSGPLDAWGRASRLSYFLWGSLPDAELRASAAAGRLLERAELVAQAQRMIDDPRFLSFARRFGGGWLGFGGIFARLIASPQYGRPRAAYQEALANFADAVRANLRLRDFLVADETWVNHELRSIYRLPPPTSQGWSRTPLRTSQRHGFLTQAAFLMTFERSTVRGLAVLSRFLCERPPPPPSNAFVASFSAGNANLPMRQRLMAHSQLPNCAGCHAAFDPMGFAFNHFDNMAEWRETEAGFPVDSSGRVSGFGSFQNLPEYIELLRNDRRLTPCAASNLLVFATGRSDAEDESLARAAVEGPPLRDLISAAVTSEAFLSYEVSM